MSAEVCPAYDHEAGLYESRTRTFHRWRRRLVDELPLAGTETVLDVGCGTGLCLPMLQDRVGGAGAVIGIDESPRMLALAQQRVTTHGWPNVTLIEAPVEEARIPATADAALFCAVHDVLRSATALRNVFAHLRRGAWVAACGGKWAPPWMVGVNAMVAATHRPFVRDFEGFDRPWSRLAHFVEDLRVREVAYGGGYLAVGRAARTGRTA